MRKTSLVHSCQILVTKQMFAALLSGIVATSFTAPSFAQEGETKEATAETQVEVPAPPATTAEATTTVEGKAIEGQPLLEAKTVEGQPPPEAKTVEGFEITAEKVAVSEAAELGKFWLGLGLKKVEGDLATYLGSDNGMFIFEIYPDSPAAKAEWKAGDILLSFNGKEVSDFETLLSEISAIETKTVKCVLLRKGDKVEEEIAPEARPENVPQIEGEEKSSWTFEALPQEMVADGDGKNVMILRALPLEGLKMLEGKEKVFTVEGGELKLPEEALKAIPELGGALKSLKNIEVTQIGEGVAVFVPEAGEDDGEKTVEEKNVSVSVIRKSEEDPGTYTVIINGEKFEGSMDKIKEAPEKVQKALGNVKVGTKAVNLQNGVTMTISPKMLSDKSQKEIEIVLKKAEEAAKKAEGSITATIVTDGKDGKPGEVHKNVQVIVKESGEKGSDNKKGEIQKEANVTTKSRIVIASTDEKGEVKVVELDGGNVASDLKVDGKLMLEGKLPPEVLAKIEEAKKKTQASGKKAAAIKIGKEHQGEGKMEFRIQAAEADKTEALKKEIEELRAIIAELKKQIEDTKK